MVKQPDSDTSVEYFAPTNPHSESRDEVLDRVAHDEHLRDRAEPMDVDHTTASGANTRIAKRAGIFAAAGAVFGAVLGYILSISPGPFQTDTTAGTIGYVCIQAAAFAIVAGIVATLLLMEREDGETERNAERDVRNEMSNPTGGAGIG